jgi:multidrug transporter EmrE-like cation transporter
VLSVVLWIIALSRVDVSIAYPMLSLGYVVTAIGAWYLFGEALSCSVCAIFVILVGVAGWRVPDEQFRMRPYVSNNTNNE